MMSKTRVLFIDDAKQHEIDAAIARAITKPIPLETIKALAIPDKPRVMLADRRPGSERTIASENVEIALGYRAAISFEEQPVGLCRHLSISVDAPGLLPSPESVVMIAEAFGFRGPILNASMFWVEEFEPGREAINLVQPVSA
jgi:hypothetical protein